MAEAYRSIPKEQGPHQGELRITETEKRRCESCDVQEHLRLCTSCGGVFCC